MKAKPCSVLVVLLIASCCSALAWPWSKKTIPIEITYRSATLGPGYVAILRNMTNTKLVFFVKFQRGPRIWPETLKSGRMTFEPSEKKELGWMEGLALKQGDRISITHPDYEELFVELPRSFDR